MTQHPGTPRQLPQPTLARAVPTTELTWRVVTLPGGASTLVPACGKDGTLQLNAVRPSHPSATSLSATRRQCLTSRALLPGRTPAGIHRQHGREAIRNAQGTVFVFGKTLIVCDAASLCVCCVWLCCAMLSYSAGPPGLLGFGVWRLACTR